MFLLVVAVRAGLTLLPFRVLRKAVSRLMAPGPVRKQRTMVPERLAWMVAAASRYVPGATCMTQALSAQMLLVRYGYHPMLRIGVARDGHGAFVAHAWVEQEGRVIIGEQGYRDFTPLPSSGERGL